MREFLKKLWPNKPPQVVICKLDDETLEMIRGIDERTKFIDNVVQGNSSGIAIIIKEVKKMGVDITQLDSEIALEASDLSSVASQIAALAAADQTAFADLLAKIAAGTPAVDLTAEFNALEKNRATIAAAAASLASAIAATASADPGSQTVPPTSGA